MNMRRIKRGSHPGLRSSFGSFSSLSMGSYNIPKMSFGMNQPITAVTVNESLLTPVNVGIDPIIQTVRTQEKEQIKTLNNKFVSFIDKVRFLEQQNKMLETKWKLMEEQTVASLNVEPMLSSYISSLQQQLEGLTNDKHKLDMENSVMHKHVNDYKDKYEEEIGKRSKAENEFVVLKKDVDKSYLSKMDNENKVAETSDEVIFLRAIYDAELQELQDSLKETAVVVQMDNSRDLNMDNILSDVKAQYEDMAAHSREEAENWYKKKFEQMSADAGQYGSDLRTSKTEIADLKRMIARLQNEIDSVKGQRSNLEGQIAEAEHRGDAAVHDASDLIRDLNLALQKAKQDMTRQVREYQELMNVKMALDIEISTYRKLLEGEEDRLGQESIVSIQALPTMSRQFVVTDTPQPKSPVIFIKQVETRATSYI